MWLNYMWENPLTMSNLFLKMKPKDNAQRQMCVHLIDYIKLAHLTKPRTFWDLGYLVTCLMNLSVQNKNMKSDQGKIALTNLITIVVEPIKFAKYVIFPCKCISLLMIQLPFKSYILITWKPPWGSTSCKGFQLFDLFWKILGQILSIIKPTICIVRRHQQTNTEEWKRKTYNCLSLWMPKIIITMTKLPFENEQHTPPSLPPSFLPPCWHTLPILKP